MSRAFVKENEETVEELPDRPISPHPNFVTPDGLARIEDTLARLQQEHAAALRTLRRPRMLPLFARGSDNRGLHLAPARLLLPVTGHACFAMLCRS